MSSLRQFFLKDLGLKGVSLLLAFLLWHQVASQRTVQRTVSVPVEFVNIPNDLIISNDHPRRLEVVLRSDRGSANIEERQLTAAVDLKSAIPGILEVPITDQNISRPSGLEILSIKPSKILLQLESTRRKNVAVDAEVTGEPAPGFEVIGIQVIPAQVMISGPESHVQKAKSAHTGIIDLSGRSASFSQTTFVDLDDAQLRIEDAFSVAVKVQIEEKRRSVKVKGVRVAVTPEGTPNKLYTQKIDLEGSVPLSYEGSIDPGLFQAVVDLTGLERSREPYELKPNVMIPPEYASVFRLQTYKPATVRVRKDN